MPTMLAADTLRAQSKESNMVAGTARLAERHHPHMLDAADLLKSAWDNITPRTIVRCGCNRCMFNITGRCCYGRMVNMFSLSALVCAKNNERIPT